MEKKRITCIILVYVHSELLSDKTKIMSSEVGLGLVRSEGRFDLSANIGISNDYSSFTKARGSLVSLGNVKLNIFLEVHLYFRTTVTIYVNHGQSIK